MYKKLLSLNNSPGAADREHEGPFLPIGANRSQSDVAQRWRSCEKRACRAQRAGVRGGQPWPRVGRQSPGTWEIPMTRNPHCFSSGCITSPPNSPPPKKLLYELKGTFVLEHIQGHCCSLFLVEKKEEETNPIVHKHKNKPNVVYFYDEIHCNNF